jgi:hypothetical protein
MHIGHNEWMNMQNNKVSQAAMVLKGREEI